MIKLGRDENVSKMDVDTVDSVDSRRPTSTRRALWSTSTSRKRQDGRRRRRRRRRRPVVKAQDGRRRRRPVEQLLQT